MLNDSSTHWSSAAHSPDGKLGAIVELGAEDPEVTIPLRPTGTATGRLLDENAEPARKVKLEWGRRIYLDDKRVSTLPAPKVVTDRDGRFALPELVVGQEYKILIRKDEFLRLGRRPARKSGDVRRRNATCAIGAADVGRQEREKRKRSLRIDSFPTSR